MFRLKTLRDLGLPLVGQLQGLACWLFLGNCCVRASQEEATWVLVEEEAMVSSTKELSKELFSEVLFCLLQNYAAAFFCIWKI